MVYQLLYGGMPGGHTKTQSVSVDLMGILLKWMMGESDQKKMSNQEDEVAKSSGRKERFIHLCPIV
jgi:hypothetical protein